MDRQDRTGQIDRQTDRMTDKPTQTDRLRGKQDTDKDKQTDRWTDRQAGRYPDGHAGKQTYRPKDGLTDSNGQDMQTHQ